MDARNTGTLIRALREERGLTQRQLADALGVTLDDFWEGLDG